ncbi:uncharacterized protein [Montipora foliosa]|uniref:uncharacterized protein n=1 Tax=Montipora foliosa TaxID=591990 RepID=UPI0035F1F84C
MLRADIHTTQGTTLRTEPSLIKEQGSIFMACDSRQNSTLNSVLHTFHFVTQIVFCIQIVKMLLLFSFVKMTCGVQCITCKVWIAFKDVKEHVCVKNDIEQSQTASATDVAGATASTNVSALPGTAPIATAHQACTSSPANALPAAVLQVTAPLAITSAALSIKEMVPDASDSDIQEALVAAHGDADEAASKLLGVQADSDDEDLMLSVFDDVMPDDQLPISPTAALIRFQNEN